MISIKVFLVLLKAATSANILVCVSVPGSHQYVAANVANFLGENGHNVTVFTVANETRVNLKDGQKFRRLIHPEIVLYNDTMDDTWEVGCFIILVGIITISIPLLRSDRMI